MAIGAYAVVFVTATSPEEADRILTALLGRRLIACGNVIQHVNSRFHWEDKIESAIESLIIMKTKASKIDEIVKEVKKIHTNDVPEVVAIPILSGNPNYLAWIDAEVKK